MKDLFDYPDSWISESENSVKKLAMEIYNRANQYGLEPHIINASNRYVAGWDKVVQVRDLVIKLIDQDYGCTLDVQVRGKKLGRKSQQLWKDLIDLAYCDGGPYIRQMDRLRQQERQKELLKLLMSGKQLTDEQLAGRLWCSVSTVRRDKKELKEKSK